MGGWLAGGCGTLCIFMVLAGIILCPGWTNRGLALADQSTEAPAPRAEGGAAASAPAAEYHTPLAGEQFHTVFMGEEVTSPPGTVATRPP